MKRVVVLLVLLFLVAACTTSPAPTTPTPVPPAHVKVSLLPYLTWGPLFIAEEEGFFAQQNIEVEWVKTTTTEEHIPLLASGDIDVGAGAVGVGFLNAIAGGAPIKAVAGKGHLEKGECSSISVLARRAAYESGDLTTVADLQGRPVAISSVPNLFGYLLDRALGTADLSLDDVEIVKIPIPAKFAAYKQGSIDASIDNEPIPTRMEAAKLAQRLFALEDVEPGLQYAFILFGPNLLEKNPDVGERFLVAYLQGVNRYNEGAASGRNVEILAEYTGQEAEVLQRVCWPAIFPDAHLDMSGTMAFQDWAVQRGFIENTIPAEKMYDSTPVEAALKACSSCG